MMTNLEFENLNKQLRQTRLVKETQENLSKIWDKHKDGFKYLFGLRLFEYAQGKHYDYTTEILPKNLEERTKIINTYRKTNRTSSGAKQVQRLTIGYNSLTVNLSPNVSGLKSKAAKNENYKNSTDDHIIGVTLCALYVIEVFLVGKESNKETWENLDWLNDRIDYMCNVWLEENLWLWAQCRITKKEHNSKEGGVRRVFPEFTNHIEEEVMYKAKLSHYDTAGVDV